MGRSVDGYCADTNTVYQFHGCLFHGCPTCYRPEEMHPFKKIPNTVVHQQTKDFERVLRNAGYNLVTIWEHEFTEKKQKDPELKSFVENLTIFGRLKPRDAFYGGRTDVNKMLRSAGPGEKIKYIDFTSLYPYCNKYSALGVGHPEIITSKFKPISEYFGLVLCSVLPPQDLYHAVLPHRAGGKLLFPLCRTCAETQQQQECQHSDAERALTGTWVTLEVQKALSVGYKLIQIFEVYHFDKTSTDTFKDYVNTFLKIKQESSGWPSDCLDDAAKQNYINSYLDKEGVVIDPASVEVNPGRRSVSKLCLNSLWGKFGQNDNKLQTSFITDVAEFNQKLLDPEIEVQDLLFPTEEIAVLTWRKKEESVEQSCYTNIFIACLTTAHARLKLYEELEKLGEATLYQDTDSIIYVSTGLNDPPLGNFLGEFTDELDNDEHIVDFVAAGPKNYAYVTSKGKTTCKIRGFTLNYNNTQKLNFHTLKHLITHDTETVTTTNKHKITRDRRTFKIHTKQEDKKYTVNYDKRVVLDNYDTVPYGYRHT